MELALSNFSGVKIDVRMLKRLARLVSRRNLLVSLSFVKKGRMRGLNRKFRGKNGPTDVLSFGMNEGRLLGDVVICPEIAKASAKKFGVSCKEEIARLLVHGLLHLLGFAHGKRMFDRQDRILRRAGYA